jgi:DNA-binding GntR family transcriptional regulator
MTTTDTGEQSALAVLRNFLAAEGPTLNERLPAERDLCLVLGLSRSRLRKGLAVLEAEGQVWRHVGRGTFVGPRPIPNLSDVELLTSLTSPTAVMEARMSPVQFVKQRKRIVFRRVKGMGPSTRSPRSVSREPHQE